MNEETFYVVLTIGDTTPTVDILGCGNVCR